MTKEQIKNHLSQYDNYVEMIREAVNLRNKGEKETTVNRAVAELRKSMKSKKSPNKINIIPRHIVDTSIKSERIGSLNFEIDKLSKPVIVTDGVSAII